MDFLLDPYVLAVPAPVSQVESVRDYLFDLQAWAAEVTSGRHKFWLSTPILESLWEAELYPSYHRIANLTRQLEHSIEVFDPYTVSRACEQILVEPPYIDEKLQDGYSILVDEETVIVIPDVIAERLRSEVADALRETLTRIAYAKEQKFHELATSLLFATSVLGIQDDSISVEADIYDEDSSERLKVETNWPLITAPSELSDIEGLEAFWEDTQRVIRWAFRDLCGCGVLDENEHRIPIFVVGSRFNESIRQNHWDRRPDYLAKIFRTVVKILTGYWPRGISENHELWSSPNDRRQRTRTHDGATAWRAHVTRGRLAIRLHYWLAPDDLVELSTVGPHNNFRIV